MFSDQQAMFCLASLTYRGFSDSSPGRFHTDLVGRAIGRGIADLQPQLGTWRLVWGPAVYRSPSSVLDDELMYVARSGNRYVVAIRGTNPISAFDWTFGDIWAGWQTPWPYDATGAAKHSLSSALGLAVLQRLRSPGPPGAPFGVPVASLGRTVGTLADVGVGMLAHLLTPLRDELLALLQAIATERAALSVANPDDHVLAIATTWRSAASGRLFLALNRLSQLTNGRVDAALLFLLEEDARWKASLGAGIDLLTFLAGEVAREGAIDVVVTGHSAGGALASTVALWLAETQGPNAAPTEQWDPQKQATVHCWSYAGPTAGNAAFAQRSDRILGARCQRVWNTRDLVTHAWATNDIKAIPTLFQPVVQPLPGMQTLTQLITTFTSKLGYTQVGQSVPLTGTPTPTAPTFFGQFVHQHMQAYIDLLGIAGTIQAMTFFDPLSLLPS